MRIELAETGNENRMRHKGDRRKEGKQVLGSDQSKKYLILKFTTHTRLASSLDVHTRAIVIF